MIDRKKLYRRGIGVTDLQLICCAIFDNSILIWTRDRRLSKLQTSLGYTRISFDTPSHVHLWRLCTTVDPNKCLRNELLVIVGINLKTARNGGLFYFCRAHRPPRERAATSAYSVDRNSRSNGGGRP